MIWENGDSHITISYMKLKPMWKTFLWEDRASWTPCWNRPTREVSSAVQPCCNLKVTTVMVQEHLAVPWMGSKTWLLPSGAGFEGCRVPEGQQHCSLGQASGTQCAVGVDSLCGDPGRAMYEAVNAVLKLQWRPLGVGSFSHVGWLPRMGIKGDDPPWWTKIPRNHKLR